MLNLLLGLPTWDADTLLEFLQDVIDLFLPTLESALESVLRT